ncbi:MAG: hypothetical protein ACPMAG_01740 [Limisphaerales bacterium]
MGLIIWRMGGYPNLILIDLIFDYIWFVSITTVIHAGIFSRLRI